IHEFKEHNTCDSASNSEVVIPIIVNSKLYGVLDLDSPLKSNFKDKEIVLTLEKIATELANKIKELL
ncbi:GAF domain-containing protein, partial [Mycoplasmopsis synoviae]|uniref:GAF domain-containing protein n=1 Tax=Mycoplasmopsis synoviae TaxID=2109 RepID=UPI00387B34F8